MYYIYLHMYYIYLHTAFFRFLNKDILDITTYIYYLRSNFHVMGL